MCHRPGGITWQHQYKQNASVNKLKQQIVNDISTAMDWDYFNSIEFENLGENEKDELYNTLAWLNTEDEKLNKKQALCLFLLSQELLKYKGEQVEVLLHKLDELATQQGENEGFKRIESTKDAKDSKSARSSSMEYENLEQKFMELKNKHKKQIKVNEKQAKDLDKLQQQVHQLERDKERLLGELQIVNQDDNHSDISENSKEVQKELLDNLQVKNKQISKLLRDIEETEHENQILRDKLSAIRDDLQDATKEIENLTDEHEKFKLQIKTNTETINKLSAKNENLQEELHKVHLEKIKYENDIKSFTQQVNVGIDKWKDILEEKTKEIASLKTNKNQIDSPLSSISVQQDQSQILTLNKIISERENQLMEVKSQLEEATNEMNRTTTLIHTMTEENEDNVRKIQQLTENIEQLKKQLKVAHGRGQDLQEEIIDAEKQYQQRVNDFKEIISKIQADDDSTLPGLLQENEKLKDQNYIQEKHIKSLVKTLNKLQDQVDEYQKENEHSRNRLGVNSYQVLPLGANFAKKRSRHEKEDLTKRLNILEEENVKLKLEKRSLVSRINLLTNQSKESCLDLDKNSENEKDVCQQKQIEALVEENEALRKGMHEILDNLNNTKQSSAKEIKSETFENLLRALDVKHISGWYHPAMRLQAELHNLEGINSELREQLRLVRLELEHLKDITPRIDTPDCTNASITSIYQKLETLFISLDQETFKTAQLESKLNVYKTNFIQVREQMLKLYAEYQKERQQFIDKISECEEKMQEANENYAVQREQLAMLSHERAEDDVVAKCLDLTRNNMVLERKCNYMENELKILQNRMCCLQEEYTNAQNTCMQKIHELSKTQTELINQNATLTGQSELDVKYETFNKLQKDFDNVTIKYRQLLSDFKQVTESKEFELKMFEEIHQNLKQANVELTNKLLELSELNCDCCNKNRNDDLAKKLRESELKEMNERQRANHTNNLFELVKEQLQKSEDRLQHLEKYCKEVCERNVLLQEQLKDAENRLIDFIEPSFHRNLLEKFNSQVQANEKLKFELKDMRNEMDLIKSRGKMDRVWNKEKEEELLSLKHQIVDLQAVSDDKMHVARLNSELAQLRQFQNGSQCEIENLTSKLQLSDEKYEKLLTKFEIKRQEFDNREKEYMRKISVMRELWSNLKLQYLGCIPLPLEENFMKQFKQLFDDKHKTLLKCYDAEILNVENNTTKEQYEKLCVDLEKCLKLHFDKDCVKELLNGHQEKKRLHIAEMKYRKQLELKESHLKHVFDRMKIQDEQVIKLEEELFAMHKNISFELGDLDTSISRPYFPDVDTNPINSCPMIVSKPKETQTDFKSDENYSSDKIQKTELNFSNEITMRDQTIQQLKNKISEYESNISLLRKQLADKQSQITFYERHILELQNAKKTLSENIVEPKSDEVVSLKCSLNVLQENFKQKEEEILHYQSLLKDDRDKHSMAAILMREELNMLQKCLSEEKEKVLELKSSMCETQPSKAALEQYFLQVHSLEDELSDLRTKISSLESQLQASRQEAVRWRSLANDRLETIQKLGHEMEELHTNEIISYKNEAEKWREEVANLKQLISRYRVEMGNDFDFRKILKDKNDRIHELGVMLRQAKSTHGKKIEKAVSLSRLNDLELDKEQLMKEHENLKKRFEQLMLKERNVREENRELKNKLLKKPIVLSARSDKSDKSIKDQLQRKIASLENEVEELKENLSRQIALNESHKVRIAEDFNKWNKQKHWQQTADKLKAKLKLKENDLEKLQQTCSGYRMLIERLEREKCNLENKIKTLKSQCNSTSEIEMLRTESVKLRSENEMLVAKLEMQHHQAGGLGAAILQEKLKAQERKIAILELTSKGSNEVRSEIEGLQNSLASLQKQNLSLEAENLELKLDLEKTLSDVPHLRDQIQYLESYIEVLKKENTEKVSTETNRLVTNRKQNLAELEQTVLVLKRVVEKLQTENKRLLSGKRPNFDRSISAEKLRRDYQRQKEQYIEAIQKVAKLEQQLKISESNQEKRICNNCTELNEIREQLEQKKLLLSKVKVLLQRAALKEQSLLQQINVLRTDKDKDVATPKSD